MTTETSTRELMYEIEAKDRKFRIAWVIFIFIILIVLIAVITVQLRTLAGVQEQLKQQGILLQQQKDSTDELKANTDEQLTKVSKQIDCIAEFFTQTDRQAVRITDLEKCRIVRADGSIQDPTGSSGSTNSRDNAASGSGSNSQPVDNSQNPPSNGQQPGGGTTPEPPQEPEPVEILGLPVCVPFTNACVRQ